MDDERFLQTHAPRFYSFLKTVFPTKKQRIRSLSVLRKELTRNLPDQH